MALVFGWLAGLLVFIVLDTIPGLIAGHAGTFSEAIPYIIVGFLGYIAWMLLLPVIGKMLGAKVTIALMLLHAIFMGIYINYHPDFYLWLRLPFDSHFFTRPV
jgi:uncharacterized membrane protein